MDRRLLLDEELREIHQEYEKNDYIYFEPPEGYKMKYNAIVYELMDPDVKRANNRSYLIRNKWQVNVITRNVESEEPRAIQEHFECCTPGRPFVRDNLYHFPFTIFY